VNTRSWVFSERTSPYADALYERIEEYISHFYQKYEAERRGLGFIMTVYRRRLTSSFYAVRCSLERRLKFLVGEIAPETAFDDDDLEQEELSLDVAEEYLSGEDQRRFAAELAYVRDFIQELRMLSLADSKLERLKSELNRVFRERSKALVFTQYTDTMDYLRDQLVEVYGTVSPGYKRPRKMSRTRLKGIKFVSCFAPTRPVRA